MMEVLGVENFVDSRAWYWIRLSSFVLINVVVGGLIYLLFKRAGVIGGDDDTPDAELITEA
jgi:hypothetical protein